MNSEISVENKTTILRFISGLAEYRHFSPLQQTLAKAHTSLILLLAKHRLDGNETELSKIHLSLRFLPSQTFLELLPPSTLFLIYQLHSAGLNNNVQACGFGQLSGPCYEEYGPRSSLEGI